MKLVVMTEENLGREDDWVAKHSPPIPEGKRIQNKKKELVNIMTKINATTLNSSRL